MPEQKQTGGAGKMSQRSLSPGQIEQQKQRILAEGVPSVTSSIARAVVLKDQNVFFLTEPDGEIPLADGHGFGLYYHDCRYLNGYELRLADDLKPNMLVSTTPHGFMAILQLANPDIRRPDGTLIPQNDIGIKWERVVDGATLALHDSITVQNFGLERVTLPLSLALQAGFQDVFAVRELVTEPPGNLRPPVWEGGVLSFVYEGKDGLYRSLSAHFSPAPQTTDGSTAHFRLELQPAESKRLLLSLIVAESSEVGEVQPKRHHRPDIESIQSSLQRSADRWVGHYAELRSDNSLVNRVLDRSFRDLHVLRSTLGDEEYFAAGVPWFTALFGRDSIITALQTLAYDPNLAERTLRVLANHQGERIDDWRDEQPGKILHELRLGELARLGEVPHTPYYGAADTTPLFLILVGRHAAWTGSLDLFNDLRGNIDRALDWIDRYGDLDGDGYIEYERKSEKGLFNQGWKDSGDAIVNADGSTAKPPIALIEVQAYVYYAKTVIADLFRRAGEVERADRLQREAADLRQRFNRDFWLEDKGFYALALQADNRPADVISSNPGHALWAGIADLDKGRRTVARLMGDDMFSGWGVRTLSDRERRFNPNGYHVGTVWPHDNAIIAAGCRRYGYDDAVLRIFAGIVDAATFLGSYQLPELFAGFRRDEYGVPVHYPVANHPQAWAAGTVPSLVESLLGLVPEAFDRRLRIVRPMLPDTVGHIEIRRLRVGTASVDLRFERAAYGVAVQVLGVDGQLEVVVELTEAQS